MRWRAMILLTGLTGSSMALGFLMERGVYETYPRFALPPVDRLALLPLAVTAGLASLFSPCSFSLLLGLLGWGTVSEGRQGSRSLARRIGGLALGASLTFLAIGIGIGLGAATLVAHVTFPSTVGRLLRLTVAIVIGALGLAQLGWWSLPTVSIVGFGRRILGRRSQESLVRLAALGSGYVLAGFG